MLSRYIISQPVGYHSNHLKEQRRGTLLRFRDVCPDQCAGYPGAV